METVELIDLAQKGDKEAREQLIEKNIGLIWSVVRRFSNRGYDMEDLFQIGCIGMLKAIDKFDTSFNVQLSTYAVPMISGEIKRFLRDDGIIKISRGIKENAVKVSRAREKLREEYGREVTLEEISIEAELELDDIAVAMDSMQEVESIYKTVYNGEDNEILLLDKIGSNTDDNEKVINDILLKNMIGALKEEEKKLISLRYFEDKTQNEVAKLLGISQVQVSRMEKKILMKMRDMLA